MKKDGSVLIEVIASVCIITIVITAFMQAYVSSINNLKSRMLEESIESVSFFIFLPSFKNDRGQYSEECCSKKN